MRHALYAVLLAAFFAAATPAPAETKTPSAYTVPGAILIGGHRHPCLFRRL